MYKDKKIGKYDVTFEGDITPHVIGLSLEWGAGRAKSYYRNNLEGSKPYTLPAYLNLDMNLPFSWFRLEIRKRI